MGEGQERQVGQQGRARPRERFSRSWLEREWLFFTRNKNPSLCPFIRPSVGPSLYLLPSIRPSLPPSVRPSVLPFVSPSDQLSAHPLIKIEAFRWVLMRPYVSKVRPPARPSVHPSVRHIFIKNKESYRYEYDFGALIFRPSDREIPFHL